MTAAAIAALALLAGLAPSLFGGVGAEVSAPPTPTHALRSAGTFPPGDRSSVDPPSRATKARGRECPLVAHTYGYYVNPLANAHVIRERIDMGVDYAGSGTLAAIGAGKVTYVATSGTGWPGAFIEYRLLDGPDSGCYVYYAEGVIPVAGLHVGETVRAGQELATIIRFYATGIELGWGAGSSTTTYASKAHQWSFADDANDIPSLAGKSFSALIAFLGGPPGKIEGRVGAG